MKKLQADRIQLTVTALNISRTAYASFALDAKSFFINYESSLGSSTVNGGDRFTCQLLNRVGFKPAWAELYAKL